MVSPEGLAQPDGVSDRWLLLCPMVVVVVEWYDSLVRGIENQNSSGTLLIPRHQQLFRILDLCG